MLINFTFKPFSTIQLEDITQLMFKDTNSQLNCTKDYTRKNGLYACVQNYSVSLKLKRILFSLYIHRTNNLNYNI